MALEPLSSLLAAGALQFAFEKATLEGQITIGVLVVVSLFSWTVIISKARQLMRARKMTRKFFEAYRVTRDPLDLFRAGTEFEGAPAYELYAAGAEELTYHLKNNPVATRPQLTGKSPEALLGQTDILSRSIHTKVSLASLDSIKLALERTAGTEALSLEKGMIVLSTAVAGGPFIGLLGTVWGVMETFASIAKAASASLTTMAPGVAGALIATVIGLLVAIPAMFAYNFMVTSIRALTQELDHFTAELVTAFEHRYVDNRPLAEEIADALEARSARETDLNPA